MTTVETVADLAQRVNGQVHGDGSVAIRGIGDLRSAGVDQIGFVRNAQFADLAKASRAGALIVDGPIDDGRPQIVVPDPQLAFAQLALHFHPAPRATQHRLHPTAVVHQSARLAEPVEIGAHVVVEAGARIGAGSVVQAGVIVGRNARIGADCTLHARVVLYDGVTLGDRVIVHSGSVLGADGFGFAPDSQHRWHKVPQVGTVEVGDDVEIGANCTIDRGTMGATRIGRGTKIDNVVHIGHNCVVGEDCAIAGFGAFSGSTILGDRVACAGHVVSGGHLKVCDDVRIGGNSVLTFDVDEPGDYMGYPLQPIARWGRSRHILGHLIELRDRVRAVERSSAE